MKVSLEWLNDYVDLEGLAIEEISHALTMVGFEVESVDVHGIPPLENVVVGEIQSFEQHPNADRLSVCQVTTGSGGPRTIVCGAKNFAAGDRVIVALPGAVLPGDFKIKESQLRGVQSQGMLCSEKELGAGADHAGIAILQDRPELGTPVNELFPPADPVFDVEVTPNRPDALSHIGIARELAAWFGRDLRYPEIRLNPSQSVPGKFVESVTSEEPKLCPHYRGANLRGIEIQESPDWMKRRLEAVGLRPINNVVDITNYVLMETGQPLHAFDADKIRGSRILIRRAREGEKITTLDDKERKLSTSDLVIADGERPLVIAGIMGSLDAEVDEETRNLFLEAAYFNPICVRRTSKRLGLSTDSSYRFERGVDPRGARYAALRCIDLLIEFSGAELLGPLLIEGEEPLIEREISIQPAFIRERLGFAVSDEEIASIFRKLELDVRETVTDVNEPVFRVGIPSFREDLYRRMDLVEEVIRIFGSDRIPEGDIRARVTLREDAPVPVYLRAASEFLTGMGFDEAVHYTLRDGEEVRNWYGNHQGDILRIANPLASDATHLRASLLPGLLDCLHFNAARHNSARRIFECGRVFRAKDGQIVEMVSVGFVIQLLKSENWLVREQPDYFTAQKIVLELLRLTGLCELDTADIEPIQDEPSWQEGHAGCICRSNGALEAKFGLLDIALTRARDLVHPVLAGAVYFDPNLMTSQQRRKHFRAISAFPPVIRDVAIVSDKKKSSGSICRQLAEIASRELPESGTIELEAVRPFDIYEGQGLSPDQRSTTFQLVFRSHERTLKDKEVNQTFDRILKAIEQIEGIGVRR